MSSDQNPGYLQYIYIYLCLYTYIFIYIFGDEALPSNMGSLISHEMLRRSRNQNQSVWLMLHVMSERWTVAHMMFPGFMSLTFDLVHLETSTSLQQMCRIDFFLATWDFLDLADVVGSRTNHVWITWVYPWKYWRMWLTHFGEVFFTVATC